MRLNPRFLLPPAAALFWAGCLATQKDALEISQQVDNMTLQVHALKKLMGSLQSNQASLNEKLDQLGTDVSVLNESLKDSRESMSKLSGKLDDLNAGIGTMGNALGESINESKRILRDRESQRKKDEEAERLKREAERERQESERQSLVADNRKLAETLKAPKPSEIYYTAHIQFTQKKYDLAKQGFELYLEKFPDGEFADLAGYDLGRVFHAEESWEEAARRFAVVLDRYPKSDVTAGARLLYALCLVKLGKQPEEARTYLESIPADFPGTPEAARAAEALKALVSNGKPKNGAAPKEPAPAKKP